MSWRVTARSQPGFWWGASRMLWVVGALGVQSQDLPAQDGRELSVSCARISTREGFETVRSAVELPNGHLLVTVRGNPVPVAVAGDGTTSTVSRAGDGPGEFRRPAWLFRQGGDTTLVVEESGDRWVVLKGLTPVASLRAWTVMASAVELAGADTSGHVLELRATKYGVQAGERVYVSPTNAESLVVLLRTRARLRSGSAVTDDMDTLADLRGPFRGVRNHWRTPPGATRAISYHLAQPLAGRDQALLFPDGWIAVVYLDPYRVDWRDSRGRWQRGAPLPFDMVRVDEKQRTSAIARDWPDSPTYFKPADYAGWPSHLPAFLTKSLIAIPDGRVLVARTPDASRPGNFYDIVDRTGRLSGRVRLDAHVRALSFGHKDLLAVETDEDGFNWIARCRLSPT